MKSECERVNEQKEKSAENEIKIVECNTKQSLQRRRRSIRNKRGKGIKRNINAKFRKQGILDLYLSPPKLL